MSTSKFDVLTHVGPGTPMGNLFREFWLPVAKSTELIRDAEPLRLMALGEKLIAFRDTSGRVGILDHRCPHRCASLFFGRNEHDGIRCAYHGWKFDVNGQCLEQPNMPPEMRAARVNAKAYKACERNGLVWVYMGAREIPPPLPTITVVDDSEQELEIQMFMRDCNWLQGMEGDLDPSHLGFLHHGNHPVEAVEGVFIGEWLTTGRETRSLVVDTAWGTMEGHHRPLGVAPDYWHYTQFLLPSWTMPGQDSFEKENPLVRFWLPLDDTHSMIFQIGTPRVLVNGKSAFLSKLGDLPGVVVRMDDLLIPNTNDWYGRWRLSPSEENDYLIDREVQRTGSYTGIQGIQIQDKAISESMGAIVDRSFEHLCAADLMIARTRRRLLQVVENLQAGQVPAVLDKPDLYKGAMAGGGTLPQPDYDWVQFYRDKMKAIGREHEISLETAG